MAASTICSIHINKRLVTKWDHQEPIHYVKSGMKLIFFEQKNLNLSHEMKSCFFLKKDSQQ